VLAAAAVAALPAAISIAWQTTRWSYLESTAAAIPAAALGLAAILLGRRGKKRERRAVLALRGARVSRWGRRLGWLALYFAATAGLALVVYEIETYLSNK
jgi:hypothetical protein